MCRPLLYSYGTYGASALFLVGALYLFLPLLRETENASTEAIQYQISLFALDWQFSLPWWLPFVLVAVAAWLLALSKRVELHIARHAHAEFWARCDALCGSQEIQGKNKRRADSGARNRAMALHRLSLLGLESLKILTILLLLFWLEPMVVPLVLVIGTVLILLFHQALWRRQDHAEPADPGRSALYGTIRFRLLMNNAKQVFSALMPISILLLMMLSRGLETLSFDLADLLFLSLLVAALGNACAGAVQVLQFLRRLDPAQLQLWHPLVEGDAEAFFTALEQAGNNNAADNDDDDSNN